ncbi:DsbC family protein (plasmid) [Sphingomonas aurantiaca]
MSATDSAPKWHRSKGAIAVAFAVSVIGGVAFATDRSPEASTIERLKTRLPKTQVSKVDCKVVDGLCEVTAGNNLFYVDRSGRYLVIGRVYDMETRQDLTATRLLEINPDTLVGGAAKANAAPDRGDAPLTSADRPAVPTTPKHLSLAGLPKDGAIVWGNPQGKTVTVFSDFECGYCKALSNALVSLNVRVVERPISALNTRALSNQVYCAKDRVKALHSAYAREPLGTSASCNTSGLDANERFAKANGLLGTPVLVRGDGAVMEGFRSAELTAAFIAGSKS